MKGTALVSESLDQILQPESLDHEIDFSAIEGVNENENCICRPHSWLQLVSPIYLQNRIADSRFGFLNLPFHELLPSPSLPSPLPSPISSSAPKVPFLSSHYSGSCRWCYDGQPDGYVAYKLLWVATNWVWSRVIPPCPAINPFRAPSSSLRRGCSVVQKKKSGLSGVSELVSDKICSCVCLPRLLMG